MASPLASTSALSISSLQHDVRRTCHDAWALQTSPRSLSQQQVADHDDPSEPSTTPNGPRLMDRRRARAPPSTRSLRLSAPLSVPSLLKMGLGCLLLAIAIASEPVRADNVTSLTGTWASGSAKVMTGLGFYNPITQNFTTPTSGGVAYSFVEDMPGGGHFETSTFTFTSNSGTNRCFTAALTWQHGTFTVNTNNGSLSLTPYPADGLVQVMAPCAAESTAQYSYSQFELIPQWYNYKEPLTGFDGVSNPAYALQMYNDDGTGAAGTGKSVMYMVSNPPTMLPAQQLFEVVLNPTS